MGAFMERACPAASGSRHDYESTAPITPESPPAPGDILAQSVETDSWRLNRCCHFWEAPGPEGKGLALRLAMAGESVVIGSRDAGRAQEAAEELLELAPGKAISGSVNHDAAAQSDVVFLTMPYNGMSPTIAGSLEALDGKIVVTVIAPMRFERGVGAIAEDVPAGSAAQEAQAAAPGGAGDCSLSERIR